MEPPANPGRFSLILDSGLEYHRQLDEQGRGGEKPAISRRTEIENQQASPERWQPIFDGLDEALAPESGS